MYTDVAKHQCPACTSWHTLLMTQLRSSRSAMVESLDLQVARHRACNAVQHQA